MRKKSKFFIIAMTMAVDGIKRHPNTEKEIEFWKDFIEKTEIKPKIKEAIMLAIQSVKRKTGEE